MIKNTPMEKVFIKWGRKLQNKEFYLNKVPKKIDKDRWTDLVNKIFRNVKYKNDHKLAYSERLTICRLYSIFHQEPFGINYESETLEELEKQYLKKQAERKGK